MGVYLIYDRLTSGGEHVLVFKTNGGEIRIDLKGERNQEEAEALIARMFELKAERESVEIRPRQFLRTEVASSESSYRSLYEQLA